ncbi:MAG: hypothetical protein ACKO5P_09115 [Nodosilinea sp.]
MTRSPKPSSRLHRSRQQVRRWRSAPDLGLILLCGGLYLGAGLILTGLPEIAWIGLWPLGVLGLWLQVYSLSQTADRKSPLWRPDLLGPILFTGVLAISLNHLGTNQIDRLTPGILLGQALLLSMAGFLVAAICLISTQTLSNQLFTAGLKPHQVRAILLVAGIVGLCLGGLGGLILKLL